MAWHSGVSVGSKREPGGCLFGDGGSDTPEAALPGEGKWAVGWEMGMAAFSWRCLGLGFEFLEMGQDGNLFRGK